MRTFSLTIAILFCVLYSKAQVDTTTTYIDGKGNVTKKNADDAKYIRKVYWQEKWHVSDYFIAGGLQMKGQYSDKDLKISEDTFYFYYENGELRTKAIFKNAMKIGTWYNYFDDSKLDNKCTYKADNIKKYVYYHYNGETSAVVEYQHDTIILNARMWDSTGVPSTNSYLHIDATLIGYEDNWYRFFEEHMYFPKDELGNSIYAKVKFRILIDRFGKIKWDDIIGFANPKLALELEQIVEKMPLSKPAIYYNRPVDSDLVFSINFEAGD